MGLAQNAPGVTQSLGGAPRTSGRAARTAAAGTRSAIRPSVGVVGVCRGVVPPASPSSSRNRGRRDHRGRTLLRCSSRPPRSTGTPIRLKGPRRRSMAGSCRFREARAQGRFALRSAFRRRRSRSRTRRSSSRTRRSSSVRRRPGRWAVRPQSRSTAPVVEVVDAQAGGLDGQAGGLDGQADGLDGQAGGHATQVGAERDLGVADRAELASRASPGTLPPWAARARGCEPRDVSASGDPLAASSGRELEREIRTRAGLAKKRLTVPGQAPPPHVTPARTSPDARGGGGRAGRGRPRSRLRLRFSWPPGSDVTTPIPDLAER